MGSAIKLLVLLKGDHFYEGDEITGGGFNEYSPEPLLPGEQPPWLGHLSAQFPHPPQTQTSGPSVSGDALAVFTTY